MTTPPPIKISDETVRVAAEALYGTNILSGSIWVTGDDADEHIERAARAVVEAVAPLIAAQVLREAAQRVERRGSLLCDCEGSDSEPTNPDTKARMDHHCDCAAVYAAAEMLGSGAATTHAAQCSCGVVAAWTPEPIEGPGRSLTEDAP